MSCSWFNRRGRPVSWSRTEHTTEHKCAQVMALHTTELALHTTGHICFDSLACLQIAFLTFEYSLQLLEPTTVGSLWLENDLHENELEFESYMGRSKKNVRVTSDGIHAEIHEIWTCVAPAAPPLFHAAVNPCLKGESPWNWSCNSVNLRKSTVTWMRRHYVFTVISRWSTFSSTVNVCNINCIIFSDTHCSFGPPILWHSPFHAGVSVY